MLHKLILIIPFMTMIAWSAAAAGEDFKQLYAYARQKLQSGDEHDNGQAGVPHDACKSPHLRNAQRVGRMLLGHADHVVRDKPKHPAEQNGDSGNQQ